MWYRLHGRHAQQAQVPWTGKTHAVLPHSWLEKPRFSWGRECNGQLIREGSMVEESLKYLLGSALRRGVGGGEGDSRGWGRDLTGESSRSHSGALVGSGLLPRRHFHRGPEEGQAQRGCVTCPRSASQASCLLNFRDS